MLRAAARAVGWLAAALALTACASLPTRQDLLSMRAPHESVAGGAALADGRARFREIFCAVLARSPAGAAGGRECAQWLWQLDDEPAGEPRALPQPDLTPQVFLVTGAFSECVGEGARPFRDAADRLSEKGYRIATIVVGGRSGSGHNAAQIAERLSPVRAGEEGPVTLIGYSKGANDVLEFLVRHSEAAARVRAVVSVAGAVAGSPLADEGSGLYESLFDWVPSDRCPRGDGQVVESLRTDVRRDWLARNALPSSVQYFSLAAFTTRERIPRALYPSWKVLLRLDPRSDGQLLARDALIPGSMLLGYVNADHWSAAIDVESVHPFLGARREREPFPRAALLESILLQLADALPGHGRPGNLQRQGRESHP